jgi:hypothetical protein
MSYRNIEGKHFQQGNQMFTEIGDNIHEYLEVNKISIGELI